jgi:hypothetical protein
MQSLSEIADEFTALMASGDVKAAAQKYWAHDISIIEPGEATNEEFFHVTGFAAAQVRLENWLRGKAMADVLVDGPFITGDNFALFIDMDLIDQVTGARAPFSEIAVYTVRDGKITEERHFHG